MQVSLTHGIAFLCTPKNASNSIEDMLRPHVDIDLQGSPQVRHTNVRTYQEFLLPYLAAVAPGVGIETIALVREPVSWLYSWYRFRARSALRAQQHENSTSQVSFAEFIEAYLAQPQPAFARVGSQAEFLLDANGVLGVDHLFAYDHIEDLVAFLGERIGERLSLRAINVSPAKVYQSNVLEKLDFLRRGFRARVMRDTRARKAPAPDLSLELTGDLRHALASRLRQDFELYEGALARHGRS